jgi:hypothetical protein
MHFGPTIIQFILYQYFHCHVTQPLLLEQLRELGIDISAGQLNNLSIDEKDYFHQEKDRIIVDEKKHEKRCPDLMDHITPDNVLQRF